MGSLAGDGSREIINIICEIKCQMRAQSNLSKHLYDWGSYGTSAQSFYFNSNSAIDLMSSAEEQIYALNIPGSAVQE